MRLERQATFDVEGKKTSALSGWGKPLPLPRPCWTVLVSLQSGPAAPYLYRPGKYTVHSLHC